MSFGFGTNIIRVYGYSFDCSKTRMNMWFINLVVFLWSIVGFLYLLYRFFGMTNDAGEFIKYKIGDLKLKDFIASSILAVIVYILLRQFNAIHPLGIIELLFNHEEGKFGSYYLNNPYSFGSSNYYWDSYANYIVQSINWWIFILVSFLGVVVSRSLRYINEFEEHMVFKCAVLVFAIFLIYLIDHIGHIAVRAKILNTSIFQFRLMPISAFTLGALLNRFFSK